MSRPKDQNAPSRWNMRIWDDEKKEWLCQSDKDALTYYGFDITGGETTEFQGLPKWHPDRHLIWEQSTGLKDKNGIEVYEGDLVRCILGNQPIVFHDCRYWLGETLDDLFVANLRYDLEVIGNIHENQDLIEGELNEANK